jgi:Tfp pilus assembly protein PilF
MTGRPCPAAIALLEEAVAQDPDYALAHAALAEAHWRQHEETRDADQVRLARRAPTAPWP